MANLINPVKPFIRYSVEMRTNVPIMAYYSKMYAITKGLEILKGEDATG